MALILARSPYFIERGDYDTGSTLSVNIGYVNDSNIYVSLKIYILTFSSETHLDISPLIRDYLIDYEVVQVTTTVFGTIDNVAPETPDIRNFVATDGYGYYEEGANKDHTDLLKDINGYYAGSNNVVYRNRDEPVTIPLLNPEIDVSSNNSTTLVFYKGNYITSTKDVDLDTPQTNSNNFLETVKRIQYVTQDTIYSFQERVENDLDSTIELINLSRIYDYLYVANTPDRVVISPKGDASKSFELTIVPIQECKYPTNKLIFKNKLGVEEDLWFFKKSTHNISTKRESFRANTLSSYISGDKSKHSHSSYNLNGRQTMSLNTGFIPESFKENIKQLMLSEKVWIMVGDDKLPITIKDSDMELKTSLNEKLINYEIEIEFAYDIINNIG